MRNFDEQKWGISVSAVIAVLDVIGCAAMLVTLAVVHPPLEQPPVDKAVSLRGVFQGISTARKTSGIPTLLMCVAVVAGAVIPAVVLGIPLAARERGWTAGEAGLIEAGWIAGGILAGAWFAWRGTAVKAWRPMAIGPLVITVGLGLLAVASHWIAAAMSTTLIGVGVVIFTAHLFPTYVSLAPPSMMSRFQSLLILAQQAPQLVINPLIGIAVTVFGTAPMIGASGILALFASLAIIRDKTLRALPETPAG